MSLYNLQRVKKFHEYQYEINCLEKFLKEYLTINESNQTKNNLLSLFIKENNDINIEDNSNLSEILRYIMLRVLSIIESIASEEEEHGKSKNSQFIYILAVFTDERFLEIDKSVYEFWINNLIEYQLFETRQGGENLIKSINNLLSENKSYHPDLAYIYLSIISLGYKGKYRKSNNQEILNSLKQELFLYAFKDKISNLDEHLTLKIENIDTLLPEKNYTGSSLPKRRKIYIYILYATIIYLIITYILFILIMHPLENRLDKYNTLINDFVENYK
ncbi:DotU family type IV/VI secretion system protein [Pigmentibacter ruber]